MKKTQTIKHSTETGRFITKPLGKGKAAKFARVEGMALNGRSATTIARLEGSGLTGDALRSAITGTFVNKRG